MIQLFLKALPSILAFIKESRDPNEELVEKPKFSPALAVVTLVVLVIGYEAISYGVNLYKEVKTIYKQNVELQADNDHLKEHNVELEKDLGKLRLELVDKKKEYAALLASEVKLANEYGRLKVQETKLQCMLNEAKKQPAETSNSTISKKMFYINTLKDLPAI